MKYLLIAVGFVMGVTLAIFGYVHASQDKVTICHATSSETNPWVRIVVSPNAIGGHFDNPGTPKAGHEDDVLLQGDVACPGEPSPSPSTSPTASSTPSPSVSPEPSHSPEPTPTEGGDLTHVPQTLPEVGASGL